MKPLKVIKEFVGDYLFSEAEYKALRSQMESEEEIWKDVAGYEDLYRISNKGRLYGVKRGNVIATKTNRGGYVKGLLYKDGKRKDFLIHRLVGAAFCQIPVELIGIKSEINHINNIRSDNRSINLEWVSRSGNLQHAVKYGGKRSMIGEGNPLFGKRGGSSTAYKFFSKVVIDLATGIYYVNCKEAAEAKNVPYSTLRCKLNGQRVNNTSLIYV